MIVGHPVYRIVHLGGVFKFENELKQFFNRYNPFWSYSQKGNLRGRSETYFNKCLLAKTDIVISGCHLK